jgi:hypothetical protein
VFASQEWLNALFRAWLLASPWVLVFSDLAGAMMNTRQEHRRLVEHRALGAG